MKLKTFTITGISIIKASLQVLEKTIVIFFPFRENEFAKKLDYSECADLLNVLAD